MRSGDTSLASRIIRRAVSVNTHTSAARSQSARSVSAWRTDGADRTVCSVRTIGCRSSGGERQDVRAVVAAEDPVLVLDDDDVVAAALEHAGGGRVVAALILVDPGDDLGRLIDIVVADDGHEIDRRRRESARSSASRRSRENVPIPHARGG